MIRLLVLITVVAVALVVAGCSVPGISGRQPSVQTPKAVLQRASADSEPDVRLISLEFTPPINEDGTCDGLANRTLLVAVDNRGGLVENDVEVRLELRSSTDNDLLVSQSQTISILSSGEVKVLKFTGFALPQNPPVLNLSVDVKPIRGERNIDNNHKYLVLRVTKP